jgi:hypothetical protein
VFFSLFFSLLTKVPFKRKFDAILALFPGLQEALSCGKRGDCDVVVFRKLLFCRRMCLLRRGGGLLVAEWFAAFAGLAGCGGWSFFLNRAGEIGIVRCVTYTSG